MEKGPLHSTSLRGGTGLKSKGKGQRGGEKGGDESGYRKQGKCRSEKSKEGMDHEYIKRPI